MKPLDKLYFVLGCIFCTTVVTGNLTFQKFISLEIPFIITLDISVGVLLYPITFLISDLLVSPPKFYIFLKSGFYFFAKFSNFLIFLKGLNFLS